MNISGKTISHKIFGSGVISDLTADTVTISFSEGEKRFIYPDAFKEHLIFQDKKTQQYITNQITERDAELERLHKLEQAETERKQKLLSFTITASSHAAFDIAPKDAKQVCDSFMVSTGKYLSGYSRGKPRIAERMQPNSVCLLTERPEGKTEQERRIIGAFMVKEDFFGEDFREGFIEGHPQHRMLIPDEKTLLFWDYFSQDTAPRWGNTAFKYCSDAAMNRILSEMAQMLGDSEQKKPALAFYQYFCKINRLRSLIEADPKESEEEKQ